MEHQLPGDGTRRDIVRNVDDTDKVRLRHPTSMIKLRQDVFNVMYEEYFLFKVNTKPENSHLLRMLSTGVESGKHMVKLKLQSRKSKMKEHK